MKAGSVTHVLASGAAALLLVGCGPSDEEVASEAGADACSVYQKAIAEVPEAIADFAALAEIKGMLSDLDDPTRRAFAGLITAADANPYLSGADPNATDKAAAEVRAVCLSEHGVEVEN